MENAKCGVDDVKPDGLYNGRSDPRAIGLSLGLLRAFYNGLKTQGKKLKETSSLTMVLHLFERIDECR